MPPSRAQRKLTIPDTFKFVVRLGSFFESRDLRARPQYSSLNFFILKYPTAARPCLVGGIANGEGEQGDEL